MMWYTLPIPLPYSCWVAGAPGCTRRIAARGAPHQHELCPLLDIGTQLGYFY